MMKIARCVLLIGVALSTNLLAQDISGSWKVFYDGPPGTGPKPVGSILLDLKVDEGVVSGTVTIGAWPGEAPIADAKLEDGHLTFTATGRLSSSTGIPTCKLDVTVQGDEMFITLTAIKSGGGPLQQGWVYKYKGGRRVEQSRPQR